MSRGFEPLTVTDVIAGMSQPHILASITSGKDGRAVRLVVTPSTRMLSVQVYRGGWEDVAASADYAFAVAQYNQQAGLA